VANDGFNIWCEDGVRQKLHYVKGNTRFHLSLESDGFVKDEPVYLKKDLTEIRFKMENRYGNSHHTTAILENLPEGMYSILINDEKFKKQTINSSLSLDFLLEQLDPTQVKIKKL
jgi:hypothetical protein